MSDNEKANQNFEPNNLSAVSKWMSSENSTPNNNLVSFSDIYQTETAASQQWQTPIINSVNSSDETKARLVVERGQFSGKEFLLVNDEINIGRWDADNGIFPDIDLDADDPEAKVSRRHAKIIRRNNEYLIEDVGSTNGTFVNRGRRLLPGNRQILCDNDEIIVGKTFLRFQIVR